MVPPRHRLSAAERTFRLRFPLLEELHNGPLLWFVELPLTKAVLQGSLDGREAERGGSPTWDFGQILLDDLARLYWAELVSSSWTAPERLSCTHASGAQEVEVAALVGLEDVPGEHPSVAPAVVVFAL